MTDTLPPLVLPSAIAFFIFYLFFIYFCFEDFNFGGNSTILVFEKNLKNLKNLQNLKNQPFFHE